MKHDAVIVGAGLAGLYCALQLCRRNWRVEVIDYRDTPGVPVRCGEATGNRRELGRFVPIDESFIAREISGVSVHFNGKDLYSRDISDAGLVLHRDRFEQYLAVEAQKCGAHIRLNTRVVDIAGISPGCTGVMLDTGEMVEADYCIAADGAESLVGRSAGITRTLMRREAFSAAQYTVASDFITDSHIHFFIGHATIPCGYIWVFPRDNNMLSVGAGLYGCAQRTPRAAFFLEAFMAAVMPGVKKHSLITGCVPLALCPRVLHRGRVAVVGDAARQCNPLTAGGIMNALEASDLLVHSLCAGKNKRPAALLGAYSQTWRRNQRRQQKLFLWTLHIFLACPARRLGRLLAAGCSLCSHGVRRDIPFRFPVLNFLRCALPVLPLAVKKAWVLFR